MGPYLIFSIPRSVCRGKTEIQSPLPILPFSITSLMQRHVCCLSTFGMLHSFYSWEIGKKPVLFTSFPLHSLNFVSLAAMTFSIYAPAAERYFKFYLPCQCHSSWKTHKSYNNMQSFPWNCQYIFISSYLCTTLQGRKSEQLPHTTAPIWFLLQPPVWCRPA